MITLPTTSQRVVSFRDENDKDAEISRVRRKRGEGRSKKKKPVAKTAVVSSDEESSSTEESTTEKGMVRTVSFDENNIEQIEVPRISRKYKARCWITKEEIRYNIRMNKVRKMVRAKLVKLLAKNDEFFVDEDETETDITESETETADDDLLEGLSQQHGGQIHQEEERIKQQRTIKLARKDRLLQHLLDSIMERSKEEIHSFLTSKCSITFNTKKKC